MIYTNGQWNVELSLLFCWNIHLTGENERWFLWKTTLSLSILKWPSIQFLFLWSHQGYMNWNTSNFLLLQKLYQILAWISFKKWIIGQRSKEVIMLFTIVLLHKLCYLLFSVVMKWNVRNAWPIPQGKMQVKGPGWTVLLKNLAERLPRRRLWGVCNSVAWQLLRSLSQIVIALSITSV